MEQEQKQPHAQPAAIPPLSRLWITCFTGRDKAEYWWDRFTDQHFRHCFVLQYQADVNRWVMLDWRTGICDVVVMHPNEVRYVLAHLEKTQGTAIIYRGRQPEEEKLHRLPIFHCVQACLQLLGLPGEWTITPKQLYKRLMKLGGEELVCYRT